MLIAGIIALILGYIVLQLVNAGIHLVWETVPGNWQDTPIWYVTGVLVVAAVAVFVVRKNVGDAGHSPLAGIGVSPLEPKDYVGAILAILASLWGGIVLGPEVALVSTGSMVGTVVATRMGFTGEKDAKRVVGMGALGAILALVVGPLLSGSATLSDTPTSIEFDQLAWAIAVAVVATVAVTIARLIAALFARAAGKGPHLPILIISALIIAAAALIVQAMTDQSVMMVVTSGEEMISDLPTITSISTIVAILIFKTIAYAASLGSGFRGGPFFPAMFVGAAAGLLFALILPDGPTIVAAIAVGVVAATIATAAMSWRTAAILGVVLGFFMGGWALIPASLIGAMVARAIPRLGDRIVAKEVDQNAH